VCNEFATLPQKWINGDLRGFYQNVERLPFFRKTISLFSYDAPFGYDKSANEGTVTFWTKSAAISPSPLK